MDEAAEQLAGCLSDGPPMALRAALSALFPAPAQGARALRLRLRLQDGVWCESPDFLDAGPRPGWSYRMTGEGGGGGAAGAAVHRARVALARGRDLGFLELELRGGASAGGAHAPPELAALAGALGAAGAPVAAFVDTLASSLFADAPARPPPAPAADADGSEGDGGGWSEDESEGWAGAAPPAPELAPGWLVFREGAREAAFARWHARAALPFDAASAALCAGLDLAPLALGGARAARAWAAPGAAAAALLALLATAPGRRAYAAHRDAALALLLAVFAARRWADGGAAAAGVVAAAAHLWLPTAALLFPMRFAWQAPVLAAAAAGNLVALRADCALRAAGGARCLGRGAARAALALGVVLRLNHGVEARARRAWVASLAAG
jgi:hypothetical protein